MFSTVHKIVVVILDTVKYYHEEMLVHLFMISNFIIYNIIKFKVKKQQHFELSIYARSYCTLMTHIYNRTISCTVGELYNLIYIRT